MPRPEDDRKVNQLEIPWNTFLCSETDDKRQLTPRRFGSRIGNPRYDFFLLFKAPCVSYSRYDIRQERSVNDCLGQFNFIDE